MRAKMALVLHLGGVGKYGRLIWEWSVQAQESGDLQGRQPPVPRGVAGTRVAAASTNFLFVAVSAATMFVSAKLAAMSCCSTAASLVAASARLSSATYRRLIVPGGFIGRTPCAPPSSSPPP
jgi:hypothetical protein